MNDLDLAEGWSLGVEEDNPKDGIRVVDAQEVTVATVWKQPNDTKAWAVNASRIIVKAPDLYQMLSQLIRGETVDRRDYEYAEALLKEIEKEAD